jgi:hypothetical protein
MHQIDFEFSSDGMSTYRLSLQYDEEILAEKAVKDMQVYVISFFATLKAIGESMHNPTTPDIDDLISRLFKPES